MTRFTPLTEVIVHFLPRCKISPLDFLGSITITTISCRLLWSMDDDNNHNHELMTIRIVSYSSILNYACINHIVRLCELTNNYHQELGIIIRYQSQTTVSIKVALRIITITINCIDLAKNYSYDENWDYGNKVTMFQQMCSFSVFGIFCLVGFHHDRWWKFRHILGFTTNPTSSRGTCVKNWV